MRPFSPQWCCPPVELKAFYLPSLISLGATNLAREVAGRAHEKAEKTYYVSPDSLALVLSCARMTIPGAILVFSRHYPVGATNYPIIALATVFRESDSHFASLVCCSVLRRYRLYIVLLQLAYSVYAINTRLPSTI